MGRDLRRLDRVVDAYLLSDYVIGLPCGSRSDFLICTDTVSYVFNPSTHTLCEGSLQKLDLWRKVLT